MTIGRRHSFRVALALALCTTAVAIAADRLGLVQGAQAQSKEEEEKKKKGRDKRPPPPPPPKAAPPQPRVVPPPPPKAPPPPPPRAAPPPPPPPARTTPPPPVEKRLPTPDRKGPAPQFKGQPQPGTLEKKGPPAAKTGEPQPEIKKDDLRRPRDQGLPRPQGPSAPPGVAPPPPGAPRGPLPPAAKSPTGPGIAQPGPKRLEDVRKDRRERVEDGGRRKVIQEPGNRTIVKENNRAIIRHDEAERFSRRPGAKSERRADGNVETFYVRDGVRIVTVVDGNGRLIRRYRRDRDGRERNIIDNRRFYRNLGVGIGIGVIGGIIALNLPPPRITIPRDRYIVDYDRASDDDLYETLEAPPIERLDRAYSLEEIRYNYELRARVRRIDLDTINFDSGSWEIGADQFHKLERIARAILRLLDRNSEAVVMIEGHTDAVGPDDENLSLADRRASAVADILTEEFNVPAENLVTQGYGEQHLKVDTQGAERLNRRVTILNITGLMEER